MIGHKGRGPHLYLITWYDYSVPQHTRVYRADVLGVQYYQPVSGKWRNSVRWSGMPNPWGRKFMEYEAVSKITNIKYKFQDNE